LSQKVLVSQLDAESAVVGAFEQAGPKLAVHSDGTSDHLLRQLIERVRHWERSAARWLRREASVRLRVSVSL